jgi:predicted helicase
MGCMVDFYNAETARYEAAGKPEDVNKFVSDDGRKISWTRGLKTSLSRGYHAEFSEVSVVPSIYRPFQSQWQYFDRRLNELIYQMPLIFPNAQTENLVIQVSGTGVRAGFSTLMSRALTSYDTIEKGQCFPLYLYEETKPEDGLFATEDAPTGLTRRDAITDAGLAHFQAVYPGQTISKEDLFHYIYGLLHSPAYRTRFANNLAKQLPRIPAVKTFADFAAFRDAGRALGDLHVNFETATPYMVTFKEGSHALIPEADTNPQKFYRVKKMKFGGKGKEKDKTTVIYNDHITLQNIPLAAYDYIVNGKAALDWVMERQVVKTDKDSGIINDANDYANETVGTPRYPLELFQRVITVSLETVRIVAGLPDLDIGDA